MKKEKTNTTPQKNKKRIRFSLRRLKITPKLLIAFIIVATLPLLIIGVFSRRSTTRSALHAGEETMHQITQSIASDIQSSIEIAHKEMFFLSDVPPVQGIIRARNNDGYDVFGESSYEAWCDRMIKIQYAIAVTKRNYHTIIYANEKGQTMTQVNYWNGKAEKVPPQNLTPVKSRKVFSETMKLPEGEIYTSTLKLGNVEQNQANIIECGIPVFDEATKDRKGLIIIELIVDHIINNIHKRENDNNRFYLLNAQGEFLYSTGKAERLHETETIQEQETGFFIEQNHAIAFSTAIIDKENDQFWKIIYKTRKASLLSEVNTFFIYLLIWSLIIFVVSIIIGYSFSKVFVNSILKIRKALLILGRGEHPKAIEQKNKDEIGEMTNALNTVVDGLKKTSHFAEEIGKGNLDVEFSLLSDKDILGNSLLEMRHSLQDAKIEEEKRKSEEEKRNWVTQGLTHFAELLRRSTNNLDELCYLVISELAKYLNIEQSAIYVINDDAQDEKYLELKSAYAYDRRKYIDKKVEIGEGLVGRCAVEKQTIHLTEIPDNYFEIYSGLGHTDPTCLLIIPLCSNDELYGVFEIASLKELEQYRIEFTEKLAETVASSISNVKINERTARLLEESKQQAEELASKEEEMRQNMEELQATQEEAARKEAEATGFVNAVNHSIIRADCHLDGSIEYANSKFLELMGYSSQEMSRQPVIEFLEEKYHEDFTKQWNRIVGGGRHIEEELQFVTKTGTNWLLATYTPVKDLEGSVIKILFLGIDIEEQKKKNLDFEGQIQAIQKSVIKVEYAPDGNVIDANDVFLNTLVYRKEDLKNKNVFSFVPQNEIIEFERIWDKVMRGSTYEGRMKKITKDGREIWVRGSYTAVRNYKGRIYKVILIAHDITEQTAQENEVKRLLDESEKQAGALRKKEKEMADALQRMKEVRDEMSEQEAVMRGQLDAINKTVALVEFNLDGTIITANNIFCEIYGYVESDLKGRHHRMFIPINDRTSEEYKQFWNDLRNGISRDGEYRRIHKNGSTIYLKGTYSPMLDTNGKPYKIIKLAFDITESKLQEAEIRGQLEAINKSNAVLEMRLDGSIISANDIFCELMQYNYEELVGRHHRMFVEEKFKNSDDYREFWTDLRNGHYRKGEVKRIAKDGSIVYLREIVYPMTDTEGRPYKIMSLAFDITESKEQQIEIQQKADELSSSEEELRQNLEELQATQEEMARKQKELELAKRKLEGNESILKRALEKSKKIEADVKQKNEALASSEEELRQNMEELQATQEAMEQKQKELEKSKIQLEANEAVLKSALQKAKLQEQEVKEKNEALASSEEELRQNMEELQATQEEMERKQTELEKSRRKLQANEAILKRALEKSKAKEQEIKEKNEALATNEEELRQNMEKLQAAQKDLERQKDELQKQNEKILAKEKIMQKVVEKTKKQEKDVKEKNSQLQAAEEELRQNLEELQATQEELERKNKEIEKIRQREKERADKQIQNRSKIMKQKMDEWQKEKQELLNKLKKQEEEIKKLKNK